MKNIADIINAETNNTVKYVDSNKGSHYFYVADKKFRVSNHDAMTVNSRMNNGEVIWTANSVDFVFDFDYVWDADDNERELTANDVCDQLKEMFGVEFSADEIESFDMYNFSLSYDVYNANAELTSRIDTLIAKYFINLI